MKVYVVSMGWRSTWDSDHCIEAVFADKDRANEYATKRFHQELDSRLRANYEPEDIGTNEEYLQAWTSFQDNYFEFTVTEKQVEQYKA